MKTIVAILSTVLLAGCGPNWDEVHKAMDKEGENLERYYETVNKVAQPADESNQSEMGEVAYEVRMAALQGDLKNMKPNALESVMRYAARYQDRWIKVLNIALNNPFTSAFADSIAGDGLPAGGIHYNIGNRYADGGGVSSPKGNASGSSASGDNEFENMAIGRSGVQTGDGTLLIGEESQNQTGDGTQAQAASRPNTQPNPSTEGGDINNNSEGVSPEVSGGIAN